MKKTKEIKKAVSKTRQRILTEIQELDSTPVWIAKQMPNGEYMIKLKIGTKDIYLNEILRFDTEEDVLSVVNANVVFVHRGDKTNKPNKKRNDSRGKNR